MEMVFAVSGLAILAAVMAAFVDEGRLPAAGMLLTLVTGVAIFLLLLPKLSVLLSSFSELAGKSSLSMFYLSNILKVMGIAYIAEFSSQICRDIGQGALAMKVELAGKIGIMVLAVPIMLSVLNSVLGLLT